ncbi:hypothetical protein [Pseudomonas sp. GM18]|uniref:hypothetical protein n=1 Tax=Pseudomonas sp. GM18 TaxID=1144324 RepID=UPI0005188AE4|nr:hypothetical protein [Pseudomonas sp. GM18]
MTFLCSQCKERTAILVHKKDLAAIIEQKEQGGKQTASLVAEAAAAAAIIAAAAQWVKIAIDVMKDRSTQALYCPKCGHVEKAPI